MNIMETYLSESRGGKGSGFYCINRSNLTRASSILLRLKDGGPMLIALILMSERMSTNNYISRIDYDDLSQLTNNTFTADYYRKIKVFDVLKEKNLIAQNEYGATMINPRFAFRNMFIKHNMEYLEGLYKYFKETGTYNIHYNKERREKENWSEIM